MYVLKHYVQYSKDTPDSYPIILQLYLGLLGTGGYTQKALSLFTQSQGARS